MAERRPRSTTYSAAHHREAKRLKAAMVDGTPCARGCGRRLYRWMLLLPRNHMDGIDADHLGTPHALDGAALPTVLSCRRCNRAWGARLLNQMRRTGHVRRRARVVPPRPELPQW
jgi:hypothetical protein